MGKDFIRMALRDNNVSPYSSEAEHLSRKQGVVSSILTGGIDFGFIPLISVELKGEIIQNQTVSLRGRQPV